MSARPTTQRARLELYQAFMEEAAREDVPPDGFLLSIQPEHGGTTLWIRDEVTGDPQQVILFVQRCAEAFGLTGRWGFQWANTCSRPRVNAFGGGAHVLDLATRETVAWTDTNGWLARTLAAPARKARSAMSIPDHARANFQTLLRAAADRNLALMECSDAVTGEPRYVICAVGRDGTDFLFTPFGHLADGNPFDAYLPPSEPPVDPSAS